jgi:hypothetical protein
MNSHMSSMLRVCLCHFFSFRLIIFLLASWLFVERRKVVNRATIPTFLFSTISSHQAGVPPSATATMMVLGWLGGSHCFIIFLSIIMGRVLGLLMFGLPSDYGDEDIRLDGLGSTKELSSSKLIRGEIGKGIWKGFNNGGVVILLINSNTDGS